LPSNAHEGCVVADGAADPFVTLSKPVLADIAANPGLGNVPDRTPPTVELKPASIRLPLASNLPRSPFVNVPLLFRS
jgi:hypothetical protein